ncbi:hypothetical protein AX16_009408 [Volvariella volvacea WC 439]|nr:hypothetical protein AX16_009408 [Volvariella volvacea WC 439]
MLAHRLALRRRTLFSAITGHTYRTVATDATKPYYLTTPIFYPNAVPHIGHLHSLVVADIFARFQRLLNSGRPVRFLAGTDEHGLKLQRAAQAKGLPPKEFCDQLSLQFRKLGEKAHISNTVFMRTTQNEHHNAVEDVWRKLDAKCLIYKGKYSGWYSVTDECFYTPTQIGPSPTNPDVMVSLETGAVVEWSEEENYMFRLSQFRQSLLDHYSAPENSNTIFPPQHHAHIVQILQEPLEDLSISRPRDRLEWGVQVPDDPTQTVYVWFDALLVYLSGIGYPWNGGSGLTEGWPVNLQIIGKDILRFHAIYLPAILQALGLPLQQQLLAHAHWTVEQKKMSKSLGNVADPFEAIDEFGIDVVRYYLARVGGRFRDDVDWSRSELNKYQKELRSLLGNFLLRITSPKIQSRIASFTPSPTSVIPTSSPIHALIQSTSQLPSQYHSSLSALELSDSVGHIANVLRVANKVIADISPWNAQQCSVEEAKALWDASLECLRVVGTCLQPVTPETAGRLLGSIGVREEGRGWKDVEGTDGVGGEKLGKVGRVGEIEGVKLF